MPENLITQLATDIPQVVIVGRPSFGQQLLGQWCRAQQLQPVPVTPSELEKLDFAPEHYWYKLIWVIDLGLTRPEELAAQAAAVARFPHPPLVITRGITPIEPANGGFFYDWAVVSQRQQENTAWLHEHIPGVGVYVLADMLDGSFDALNPLFHLANGLRQGVWSNPVVPLVPTVADEAWQALQPWVFHPSPPAVLLVKGQRWLSTQLIQHLQAIYARLFDRQPAIQAIPAIPQAWLPQAEMIELSPSTALDRALATIARSLPVAQTAFIPQPPVAAAEPVAAPLDSPQPPRSSPLPVSQPLVMEQPPAITQPAEVVVVPPAAPKAVAPEAEIDATLQKMFSQERVVDKTEHVLQVTKATKVATAKKKRRQRLFKTNVGIVTTIAAVALLIALYQGNFWLAQRLVWNAFAQATTPAHLEAQPAAVWHQLLFSSLNKQTLIYQSLFGWNSMLSFNQYRLYPQMWQRLRAIESRWTQWQLTTKQLAQQLSGRSDAAAPDWDALGLSLNTSYEDLAKLHADLKLIDATLLSSAHQQQLKALETALTDWRKEIATAQQLVPVLPDYLGYRGKKTYAILIQNNQELRPTGGFIQAVGLLTVDQGTITDSQFSSSYELDSRVVGAVKPPADLQAVLGENRWWLRDSNWSPDFPTSAAQSAWFIQQATNKSIDGVIALNLSSLQALLKATGPVDMPEYNEVLTDRNLAERLEFHSEIQLANQPGSTLPRDYTATIAQHLFTTISQLPADSYPAVLMAFSQSLQHHQTLMTFVTSQELNQPLKSLGWTGEIITPSCPVQFGETGCLVDTFAQVEANVGINKANYYVQRAVDHQVEITPTAINHTRTITWENTAQNNAWPKGTYKAYTRFYIPEEAANIAMKLNGASLAANQFLVASESGKKIVGVLTETPVQQKNTLVVQYSRPNPYGLALAYTLFEQKQPGTTAANQLISISYPPSSTPQLIAPQAEVRGQSVVFVAPEESHAFVGVKF